MANLTFGRVGSTSRITPIGGHTKERTFMGICCNLKILINHGDVLPARKSARKLRQF